MTNTIPPTTDSQVPRTHIGSLPEVLRFTDADLIANRAGQISDAQRERLMRAWSRTALIGAFGVFAIIVGASLLIFLGQRGESPVLSLIGVVLTVINAGIVGLLAQSRIRLNQDLRGGMIATAGMLSHTVKVFGRTATYVIDINGERLPVSKPVFFAFEERTAYMLYRTAANKTLLSAEKQ